MPVLQPDAAHDPLNQDVQPRKNPLKDVVVVVALPWLTFILLLVLFVFIYHNLAPLVWTLVTLCFLLSLVFLVIGVRVRHRTFIAIGLLTLASGVTACVVGTWLHTNYLERFYTLDQNDEAADLDPTVNPGAKEITVFKFLNTSFVDDMRTVGFMADRKIFCVAPVSKPMAHNASVEFWATGEDCCEARQNFDCGAARDQATFAIIANTGPSLSGTMKSKYYEEAINQAKALYGMRVGPSKPRLVYFVEGIDQIKKSLWDQTMSVCLFATFLDLVMCVAAGAIMYKVLSPKQRAAPSYQRDQREMEQRP